MIAGVAIVRNEDDIIATTIRHHLAMGLDAVFVSDNESDDDTLKIIRRMAAADRRIRWSSSRGFRQVDVVNELADEARRIGADWILPFDADEFWLPSLPLAALVSSIPPDKAYARANVINFVQQRDQIRRDPKGLLRAVYRPRTIGSLQETPQWVQDEHISFLEAPFGWKGIFRANVDDRIGAGGHSLLNEHPFARTDELVCFHIPLRSRDILDSRVEQSRRLDAAGFPKHHGWQQRYFAKQAANGELDIEWAANSADEVGLMAARRGPVPLVRDVTLARTLEKHLSD